MRKPDIFDEIVYFLRESGGEASAVDIAPEILEKLYAPAESAPLQVRKVPEEIPLYESYGNAPIFSDDSAGIKMDSVA